MDETDAEIINSLKQNARKPYTEIAEEIGTSEGTVRNRVEKMLKDGIISFTLSTNTERINSMVKLKIDPESKIPEISEKISNWNQIDFVWELGGKKDIIAAIDTENTQELNKIVTKIRNLDYTQSLNTQLILNKKI